MRKWNPPNTKDGLNFSFHVLWTSFFLVTSKLHLRLFRSHARLCPTSATSHLLFSWSGRCLPHILEALASYSHCCSPCLYRNSFPHKSPISSLVLCPGTHHRPDPVGTWYMLTEWMNQSISDKCFLKMFFLAKKSQAIHSLTAFKIPKNNL